MKQINFDMDGTIANLYGVANWLPLLQAESTEPYEMAKPLLNMQALARVLNRLHRNGYEINVISWTAKNGTTEYNERVATAKQEWLSKHLHSVTFTNITVIPYGTPKSQFGNGILFDDEQQNRNEWQGLAYSETEIMTVLKGLA